jgi:hypothetical protein
LLGRADRPVTLVLALAAAYRQHEGDEEVRMTERSMPEGLSDERGLLEGWLEYYRATLLAKCEGLSGDQLVTRSCEPSRMSLLGLIRHMTEMERVYGHRLADWGIGWLYCTDENEEGDFEEATAAGASARCVGSFSP